MVPVIITSHRRHRDCGDDDCVRFYGRLILVLDCLMVVAVLLVLALIGFAWLVLFAR